MFKGKENKKEEFRLGFNRFKKEISKRKWDFFQIFLATILIFIPFTFINFLTGKILDSLLHPKNIYFLNYSIESIWFYFCIFIFTSILWRIFDLYLYKYKVVVVGNDIYKDYTKEIFKRIISFPISFFKSNHLGKIIYSSNLAINKMSDIVKKTAGFIGYPIMVIFNMIFLLYLSWKIYIIIIFASIIYVINLRITMRRRKQITKEFNNVKKNINSKITENINFAIEIKRNLKENTENSSIKSMLQGDFDMKFWNSLKFQFWNNLFFKCLFLFTISIVIFLIILEYKSGIISEGDIMAIIMYTQAIMRNINFVINYINDYIEDFTIIGDIEKIILHKSENYCKNKTAKKIEGKIEFKNINFTYSENKKEKQQFSLKNINLKIKKGERVAFVGESGSGKSTSIELIGGFYFPDKGEILVDNISTKKWNLNDLRKSIAYVSQDVAIFNTTIKENISYGSLKDNLKDEEIIEAAKLTHIHDYIESLPEGYDTKVGEKGLKLSGGQRQRIAIARAILRNPEILILDEPTSALDIHSETYITESLKNLMKNRTATTIIIAHRISTIRDADKIYVFDKGGIVEEGNYQELIRQNGKFKKMVDLDLSKGLK